MFLFSKAKKIQRKAGGNFYRSRHLDAPKKTNLRLVLNHQ